MPIRVDQNHNVQQACVFTSEMDGLIVKIQTELRLKSKGQVQSFRHARTTPYSLKCVGSKHHRGASSADYGSVLQSKCRRIFEKENQVSDMDLEPHELLQKLLKEQTLIQEAVRRLQKRSSSCDVDVYEGTSDGEADLTTTSNNNNNVYGETKTS